MAFGWIGSTTAFGDVVRNPVDLMRPWHRLRLRAAITVEHRPDAREGEQRPVLIQCEPHHVLFLRLRVRLRGAYSAKLLAGTKQRFSALSHFRQ